MENEIEKIDRSFLDDAKQIIDKGRNAAYDAVNTAMISTYWYLGKRIVEEEQRGQQRAGYGTHLIKLLSAELTAAYGKGFTPRALRHYRQFYLAFPDFEKWNTRVPFLTWSHIRELIRVNDSQARYWYMKEASDQGWSVRTLSRASSISVQNWMITISTLSFTIISLNVLF